MDIMDFCFPDDANYKGVAENGPLSTRVYNVMRLYNIKTAEEVASLNTIQLILMDGIGLKSIHWIEERLEECGLTKF